MSSLRGENSSNAPEMLGSSSQRSKQLLENLSDVVRKIKSAQIGGKEVRLVLVSKLKPANDILALHNFATSSVSVALQPKYALHFGENYAQELTQKASILPDSVRWHMIGGLQTNKCKPLAEQVKNLWCVSSVDTTKKADALEKGRSTLMLNDPSAPKLNVQIQVNTSGEDTKSGVEPSEAAALCRYIRESCPSLHLSGLMTIGAIARSRDLVEGEENEDFECLRTIRNSVALELGLKENELELSMGMSADFENAIRAGSDEVRVGSTIFGDRPPRQDAKIKE